MIWKKIAANIIYQLFGKGFGTVVGLVTIALITRSLGAAGYGDYVLATTVPVFLYLLADFGLNAIYLRDIAQDNNHLKKFGSLLALRLGLASFLLLFGILYLLFSPYPEIVKLGIFLALFTIFFQAVFTSLNALFQHNLRYELSVLASFVAGVLGLVLVVFGYLSSSGFLFFVSAWILSSLILAVVAFFLAGKLREGPVISWDGVWIRRLFLAALPLGLTLVFSQINSKADIFLLSLLDTSQSVGIYGLAYKVFENFLAVPIFFINALYPVMLSDQKKSLSANQARLAKSIAVMFVVSLLLGFLSFILAPFLISILGGENFAASTSVLRLLSIGLPLFFITAPLQWFLITVGQERALILVYGTAAFLNVLINAVFIPQFSYFASVFATIFSELLILVLLLAAGIRFIFIRSNSQR